MTIPLKAAHLNNLRSLRLLLLPLLAAAFSSAFVAGLLAAPAPVTPGRLGQALALRAALRPLTPSGAQAKTFAERGVPTDLHRASDGRYVYGKPNMMRSGAILKSRASTAAAQVNEAVQTFDVFNPPPAFTLAQGVSLTPTNLTPVWTSDETMLVFSSNRTPTGTAGTRFHIWAIPVNGGTPIQLTTSTAATGESASVPHGEFFPALSADNNQRLAFTSDANTANVQNLYVAPFTGAAAYTVNGKVSPTFQSADASGNPVTGIGGVARPTFVPSNSDEVVFSGLSLTGTHAGHRHLYFLYSSTEGYNQNSISLPGKLTDGPADDTDPAFAQDGSYIAFASTASSTMATGMPASSDPNVAPIQTTITTGTTAASNRAIFLITGAAGVANSGAPVTAAGSGDNFGPAWSSSQSDPYLNTAPGREYIAFARGASQTSPHDIFYLNVLQNTQAGGESARSNEASSTPLSPTTPGVFGAPVFQVNAGDTTATDNLGGYVADTFLNPNSVTIDPTTGGKTPAVPSFIVSGGTADPPATPPIVFNTTGDPYAPPGIYQTDRSGTFSYIFPNLTPNATYQVRLHLADTKDSAANKRVFNVTVNGQTTESNIDIVATALQSPGRLDGLVTDASTGAALPGATVTVNAQNPVSATTTASPSTDPNGGAVINYNLAVIQGTYTVTVSAPGYGSETRQVTINSGAYTRGDFSLDPSAATSSFSGIVTANGSGVSGITLSVVDAATLSTVMTTGTVMTDANGNYGPITLPPGSYYVTATPPAPTASGAGYTTQTQAVTTTAGTAAAVNFTLAATTSTSVGSLGGLVTNSAGAAALSGVTITVKNSSGTLVAILMTHGQSSPAAPNGDGKAVNYFANLPNGTYSVQFIENGFGTVTTSVVIPTPATGTTAATPFARSDQTLTTTSAQVGQNTAIVITYTVQAAQYNNFNNKGLQTGTAGAITLAFNPVSGDPPIVQGIEILSNPNPAGSSGFGSLAAINFSSASTTPIISAFGGTEIGTDGTQIMPAVPIITLNLENYGATLPSAYNIYRSSGKPNSENEPPVSGIGTESSTIYQTVPATGNLTQYVDTGVALGSEYYYMATAVFKEALIPETASNPVVKLNTDDNAGETSTAGNAFDDIYPTWSPFRTVFSIAYSSNRTVTYTNPSSGAASETAISIAANGSLGNGGTVGAGYAGLLESQVVNLDPPTLVPYSGNEVLHVNTGSGFNAGSTTRTGVTPGQPATITVRLSDREAGVDDANVYLQIKDPDSKYDDAQGLEHKVFAHDQIFRSQQNNPNLTTPDSGSSDILMNGGTPGASALGRGFISGFTTTSQLAYFTYTGYNQFNGTNGYFALPQRGAIGGIDGPESQVNGGAAPSPSSNKSDTISVGRDGGGSNGQAVLDSNGKPVMDANKNIAKLPGGDPNLFIPTGPEYEAQVVNPTFAGLDTAPTDYSIPYWLAGVDDQQPFSGLASYVKRPATQWLPMTRLPAAQQDGQGGILYSVTWTTPTSQSDYFLDVIAFDKAVPPVSYTATGITSTGVVGSNWRIYDNIWGFSTQAAVGNNDILLVSDYALGQKFAASTFGGQRGLLNLVPKLYGAESYVSAIDNSLLPNAIYRYAVFPGADVNNPQTEVLDLATSYDPADSGSGLLNPFLAISVLPLNGLGVNSYLDRFIDDGNRTADGLPNVRSQQYTLWRTLARGPVPAALYAAYEPTTPQSQPAVSDAGGATTVTAAAASVPVANRCIVWISPFTGDVLAGPGTLADPNTQANLRAFVGAGGRLCVSGQDVGSSLTQSGTVNNGPGGFLSDVLGATLTSPNQGTQIPSGGTSPVNNRISYVPSYDGELQGGYQEVNTIFGENTTAPSQRPIRISNNYGQNIFAYAYPIQNDVAYFGNWRTDGSLDQLGPYIQGFPEQSNNNNSVVGQIDTIKPNAGANVHTDLTLGQFTNPIPPTDNGNANGATAAGGVGLIYSENPISSGGTGSKVVYATFGLEALSTEYYKQTNQFKPNPIVYAARNQRQNILHNVVSYLRTGSISGTIRATTGNNTVGAGIQGATVYLQSAYGPAIPGRGTFSATTDGSGNYVISGVEPGNYTLVSYKTGYSRAVSNKGTVLTVEGDVAVTGANLTLTQGSPGIITGVVTDSSGKPVAGAAVVFTPSGGGSTQTATTDVNGSYTLSNVPPGTYTGTASLSGATATSGAVTVTSGATLTVNFKLAPGAGSATGRVVDNSGNPISGATVYFNGGGLATPATATTGANGVYTFAPGSLPAGSYQVSATAPTFGASTPILEVITSAAVTQVADIVLNPVQTGTLGGLVTTSGSTTPLGGVTITIVNTATGQTITPAPTSVSTTTAAPDGSGSINYGPVTLPQGTYTVTATANGVSSAPQTVTIPANGFARIDFTGTAGLQPLHTFTAGFQFVSTPYDYSALGFDAVFGPLNTAPAGTTPNGNRSHVAVWNPLASAYALDPTAPADALRPGVGYWVYLANTTPVTQAGKPLTGSVSVALNPAWNQIGVPSAAGVTASNMTFTAANGTTYKFADAAGSTYHLISGTLYSYNGSAYQPVGSNATLQPWQAYWIRVYTPVTVNIPTGK